MGLTNGKSLGKKKAPNPRPFFEISYCTLSEALAENPEGYTVAFQKTEGDLFLFLKTAELVGDRFVWRFVDNVNDAGLWDLEDCIKVLVWVREEIPHAVAVAVV
jgi:hypothetical protein